MAEVSPAPTTATLAPDTPSNARGLVLKKTEATGASVLADVIDLSEMKMTVKELDPIGRATNYNVPLPQSGRFEEWSVFQQAAMLKAGAWNRSPIGQIFFAIAYANRLGLDIMQGDVYTTGDGRIATSNKAKIKMAMAKGLLADAPKFSTTEINEEVELEGYDGPEIECTVTLKVKGWDTPLVKTQRLSEWYMKSNPNWKNRPRHMLELNTLAHALETISPTETDSYEAPPVAQLPIISPVNDVVQQQLSETIKES